MTMCGEKELKLAEPLLTNGNPIHRVRADRDAFVEVLTDLRQRGALYALIMHTDSDKRLHDVMKRHERVCEGIITQGVKTSTVLKVMDKHLGQTMENLVNKANVKLGGLNYTLNTQADKKAHFVLDKNLFIGIGMNHPSGGMGLSSSGNGKGKGRQDAPPSVVGYAANYNPDPFEFCGDFILQETRRDEKVTIVEHIVKTCLERYNTTHQRYPARVILYRNGCTEGQFPDILRYEVPLVEAAIGSVCEAKLTLIVPNKMHNLRIFLKDIPQGAKIEQQNIPPGTLVDTQVVHPVNNEFYLNSHLSSQGTVKSPRYTVLHDANNLGSDRLQCMTWYLCYGHQIVNLPVSLPAPVYIADLYAYRGRSCYNACVTAPQNHPDHELAHLPLHRLTEALNYEAVELTNFRVNA
jgi:eukaryotic translation initiation factor 2C